MNKSQQTQDCNHICVKILCNAHHFSCLPLNNFYYLVINCRSTNKKSLEINLSIYNKLTVKKSS